MKKKRALLLLGIWCSLCPFSELKADKYISPHHPGIHYSGRVDMHRKDTVSFDWPGVAIRCHFTGPSVGIMINGGKENYFNLFIDDELISVFHAPRDTTMVFKNLKRKGSHELRITKRTEADMGRAHFFGILLDDRGQMKPVGNIAERKIEFIGNSITCGYGTEGSNRDERFRPDTENNYKSYAAILARAFSAEAHFIAHSGLGVVRNYGDEKPVSDPERTLPGRYNRTLDSDAGLLWNFSSWKPDCVIINLGTNDFSTLPHPDKQTFQEGYKALIMKVRNAYGPIPVFCVVGPMTNEPCFSYVKELTLYYRNILKDNQVYFTGLPDNLLNLEDDLGSDWHPSYQGQKKIAAQLLNPVATVLKWDYQYEEIHPTINQ